MILTKPTRDEEGMLGLGVAKDTEEEEMGAVVKVVMLKSWIKSQ